MALNTKNSKQYLLLIFIVGLGVYSSIPTLLIKADIETTIQPALEDGHIYNTAGGGGDWSYTAWLKFDVSSLLDQTIISATLQLYLFSYQKIS